MKPISKEIFYIFSVSIIFASLLLLARMSIYSPSENNSLGWWGWFDQSQYLKQMIIISSEGLKNSMSNSFYPPGYMIVPAIIYKMANFFSPESVLFTYNILLNSISLALLSGCLEGKKKWIFLVIVLTLVWNIELLATTLFIPWSSSISLFTASICVWSLCSFKENNLSIKRRLLLIISLSFAFSIQLHTRPQDFAILSAALVISFFIQRKNTIKNDFVTLLLPTISLFVCCESLWYLNAGSFSLGGSLYDKPVHSFVFSGIYYKLSSMLIGGDSWGYLPSSIFSNSPVLYFVIVITLIYAFISKNVFAIFMSFLWMLIYGAFSDLGLHNFVRFLLLHYYKFVFFVLIYLFLKDFNWNKLLYTSICSCILAYLLPFGGEYSQFGSSYKTDEGYLFKFDNGINVNPGDIYFISSILENNIQETLFNVPHLKVNGDYILPMKDYRVFQGDNGVYIHFFKEFGTVYDIELDSELYQDNVVFETNFFQLIY